MSDTAFELTAEERALIEANRAAAAAGDDAVIAEATPEPEPEPADPWEGRCGAPKDPDRLGGPRCRLRLREDAHGRPAPHAADHDFRSVDDIDGDPRFPQEVASTSKLNTTGNPA